MTDDRLFIPEVFSVVECRENGPLIAAAADLWIRPSDTVMDVTYGLGNFWTYYRPTTLVTHDLGIDGVDFRQLPEDDQSIDVIVFDPPYIAQGGRDTSTLPSSSSDHEALNGCLPDFLNRYGLGTVPKTARELNDLIAAGMKECARVLKPKGRLMVKCMDYVNGGRLVLVRHHVVSTAIELGLRQEDEFVHYSGPGPGNKRPGKQQHSRRAHTFLCVFVAPGRPRRKASA